jgi:hypothetical protein
LFDIHCAHLNSSRFIEMEERKSSLQGLLSQRLGGGGVVSKREKQDPPPPPPPAPVVNMPVLEIANEKVVVMDKVC